MNNELVQLVDAPQFGLKHRVRRNAVGHDNAPCLLLLHGVGANEAGLIDLALEQDSRLVVILARAPLAFGPAQFGWFQVAFTANGPAINGDQAEVARHRLLEFADVLPQAYRVDPRRIWIAGFSQGGIMSANAALTAPEKFAGFGIMSGRILPEIRPYVVPGNAVSQLHAFISHGARDQKLGIHFARDARTYLEGLGLSPHYREYEAGHELNQPMRDDFKKWLQQELG
jgi:phospholipase/carboxylesterase